MTPPDVNSNSDCPESGGDNLVTLIECETRIDAESVRSWLKEYNIPAQSPDKVPLQAIALDVHTYGFIPVLVPSKHYEKAKEVIAAKLKPVEEMMAEPGVNPARAPLSPTMKAVAFMMPLLTCPSLLILFVTSSAFEKQGCKRKSREFAYWFVGGVTFWFILFAVWILKR